MSVIYSPVTEVTTDTAQYLFRVYRRPITATNVSRLEGAAFLSGLGFELNHDDHLFSIPATTQAIMDTANRLAYATSLLGVGDKIPFIVVWLVEPGKGIDRSSPVTVLTPWQSRELRGYQAEYVERRALMAPDERPIPPHIGHFLGGNNGDFFGFESFDLIPEGHAPVIADAFIPLDVARATERGRSRHQWFYNVLTESDYYFDNKGRLFLTSSGSCRLARFPWFQATLELLQWNHSGYDVNEDGRLILGNLALTERVPNAAIDAAQRRRMFLRRPMAIQKLLRVWWDTMHTLSYGLRGQELAGWASPAGLPVIEPQGGFVYFTQVPTQHLVYCVSALISFLNNLWVATGSPALALWPRHQEVYTQRRVFEEIHSNLFGAPRGAGFAIPYIVEYDDSPTHQIAMALQDLAASVMAKLQRYFENWFQPEHLTQGTIRPMSQLEALRFAVNANEFAEQYETIQGDLHACFGLMASWQFAFKPEEDSKLQMPRSWFKTKREHEKIYNDFERYERAARERAGVPDLSGRINDEYPIFAPPRSWEVVIVNPDVVNQYNNAVQESKRQALEAARQAEAARMEALKAARRARLQGQLEALRNDIAAGGHNPNDPWAWQNNLNAQWWVTPIALDDVPEFLANAYHWPDAIDYAEDVFNLSPKVVSGLRRVEPIIDMVQNLTQPHRVIRRALVNLTRKKVGKIARGTALHYAEYTAHDNLDDWHKEVIDSDDALYETRDLWPDDEPMPAPPAPPVPVARHTPPPFQSTEPDFGGGASGQGGTTRTWDEDHADTSY